MPRVSAIIIFYNGERYFAEAIDSVLAQNFRDFELLLVDDGSTDGSTAIARDYEARHPGRVRYLEHPGHANRGMSATRNLGLAHAQGEYVAFIDADDRWHPDKLADQIGIMDRHPELAAVCGTVRYWYSWAGRKDVDVPTGHVQDRLVPPPEASLALYPLGKAAAPCPSDLMLRRDVVMALGGFEEHFTGPRQMYEDQGFLAKLYISAPVWFASKVWLDYRQHADSIVSEVKRGGGVAEVRHYFLRWFETYLAGRPEPNDPRVIRALNRALRPYRRPVADAILQFPARAIGLARRALGKLRRALAEG
jgi:glycosyltransferase involved in cell wall biosynthesis